MPLPSLDPAERHILSVLAKHRGETVPRARLLPPGKFGSPDPAMRRLVLKVRLCTLREKLRTAGYRDAIETVTGVGVRLDLGMKEILG